MPAKQVTYEKGGLTAVFREKLGSDVLDASTIHHILAEHISTRLKIKDTAKLPNRFWARIIFVANVVQQTVSLTGEGRFDIPDIDAPAEDIAEFYEFMMTLTEAQIDFFRDGLRKFDPVPNPDGGQDVPASTNGSTNGSHPATAATTISIPA